MNCPKCSGWVIDSFGELKCPNCGNRIEPTPKEANEMGMDPKERVMRLIEERKFATRTTILVKLALKGEVVSGSLMALEAEGKVKLWPIRGGGSIASLPDAADPRDPGQVPGSKLTGGAKAKRLSPPKVEPREEAPAAPEAPRTIPPAPSRPPRRSSGTEGALELVVYLSKKTTALLEATIEGRDLEGELLAIANACLSHLSRTREVA